MFKKFFSSSATHALYGDKKSPRPYQLQIINDIINHPRHLSYLVALPAQSGKTYTILTTVKKGFGKTIFVTPRRLITSQVIKDADGIYDKDRIGFIRAGKLDYKEKDFVVADIETLLLRLTHKRVNPKVFDCIIFDEAHTNRDMIEKIRRFFQNAKHIALTATPYSADGVLLHEWDYIDDRFDSSYMTENNYLLDIKLKELSIYDRYKDNFQDLKTDENGNYSSDSIQSAIDKDSKFSVDVVEEVSKEFGLKHRFLVFAGSIKQCNVLYEEFKKKGYVVGIMNSTMSKEQNDRTLQAFKDKHMKVLISVNMLLMGVAIPATPNKVIATPIRSLTIYGQMMNRGRASDGGSEVGIALDCTDTFRRLGHPDNIKGVPFKEVKEKSNSPTCLCCHTDIPLETISEEIAQEVKYITKRCVECGNTTDMEVQVTGIQCSNCYRVLQQREFIHKHDGFKYAQCRCNNWVQGEEVQDFKWVILNTKSRDKREVLEEKYLDEIKLDCLNTLIGKSSTDEAYEILGLMLKQEPLHFEQKVDFWESKKIEIINIV